MLFISKLLRLWGFKSRNAGRPRLPVASARAYLSAAYRPYGRSAMNPKVSALSVTICVGAHPRLGKQRPADVHLLFVACLLLEERLENHSESLSQTERRPETRQLVGDLLLRYGDSVGAVATVERLRLEPSPADLGGRHRQLGSLRPVAHGQFHGLLPADYG